MAFPSNQVKDDELERKRYQKANRKYLALEAKNNRYNNFFLFVTHNNFAIERIQRYLKFRDNIITLNDKKIYAELKEKLKFVTDFKDANPLIPSLVFLDDNMREYTPRLSSLYAMSQFTLGK